MTTTTFVCSCGIDLPSVNNHSHFKTINGFNEHVFNQELNRERKAYEEEPKNCSVSMPT